MMNWPGTYSWESLPEYRCTQRYGYSLGRVLTSVTPQLQPRCGEFLSRLAVLIARGIALANVEVPPGGSAVSDAERLEALETALEALTRSRELLQDLRTMPAVSVADVMVALELLERVETGLRAHAGRLQAEAALRTRRKSQAQGTQG